jgi:hypothetical protein
VHLLQHNAHFWDKGCRFEPPLTLFLTPLAPRKPRDREPPFLWLVQSNATKSAALAPPPPNNPPSLSPLFAGPKISQAQNGFPRLTRLVFRRRLPVQHIGVTRGSHIRQPFCALQPTSAIENAGTRSHYIWEGKCYSILLSESLWETMGINLAVANSRHIYCLAVSYWLSV